MQSALGVIWATVELGARGGTWIAKLRIPGLDRWTRSLEAAADDVLDANGGTVLTFAQAQEKARTWFVEQEQAAEEGQEEAVGPYFVADAVDDYLDDLRARRGSPAASDAGGRLKKHLLPRLGDRRLADLIEADFRGWRNSMVIDGDDEDAVRRSRDSANKVLRTGKAAFNLALRSGKVTDDPWRRVEPFGDVGAARMIFLSDDDQQRFADACEPDLANLVVVGAQTGCRLKELTEARRRDLDLDRATLTVKSNKGRRGAVRYRDVYLSAGTLALLRRLASGKRPDDHLLVTEAGTPWSKSLHARRVKMAVKKAGLDPETCFYSLRHSYISRALKVGIPTKAVALQCGTSIQMIEKHYGKFITADLAEYAEKAAPKLRTDARQKVVALRPGAA